VVNASHSKIIYKYIINIKEMAQRAFTKYELVPLLVFIILFPGLIFTLPAVSGQYMFTFVATITSIVVHAFVYALVVKVINKAGVLNIYDNIIHNAQSFLFPIFITLAIFGCFNHYGLSLHTGLVQTHIIKLILSVVIFYFVQNYNDSKR
jgi:hypothetical protein